MELFDNHKKLFSTAALFFIGLTLLVAIIPALNNQKNNKPLPNAEPLSEQAIKGKAVYIANGCVSCHTQQVRNIDMDKIWGERPGIAADYAANKRIDTWRNTATLMGTERTGPDLTNIGKRQPGIEWNLVHLYNPRIVVKESIMPAYPWMFTIKKNPAKEDIIVSVPEEYLAGKKGKVVADKEALYLVAYLQSLKQTKLPDETPAPDFLYKRDEKQQVGMKQEKKVDGAVLYASHCQSCHQANGEGLPGAFPALKGSSIVLDDNSELMVDIIMNGYDARPNYGVMPAVATNANLSAEEVTAIMNHEKTSWGNNGKQISQEEVKKLIEFVKLKSASK